MDVKSIRVTIFGASGFIGKEICRVFSDHPDYRLTVVERNTKITGLGENTARVSLYSPDLKQVLGETQVLINLSGANIAAKAWTESYKRELWESRVDFTRDLRERWVEALVQSQNRLPKNSEVLLINASAVGYYQDEGSDAVPDENDIKTENSPKGEGFLSDLTQGWEKEADFLPDQQEALKQMGWVGRSVKLRMGLVLGLGGGAFPQILRATRWFVGAVFGGGEQIISWISVHEIPPIIDFIIHHPEVVGPVNVVAPENISFEKFVQRIGSYAKRPVWLRVPGGVIKKALGKRADLLLKGDRIYPGKLLESGYVFNCPNLQLAFESFEGFETSEGKKSARGRSRK